MVAAPANTPFLGRHPAHFLVSGDHLARGEFERRYSAMPDGIWAELIEGIAYIAPKVRFEEHAHPHAVVNGLLGHYWAKTPGLLGCGTHSSVRLDNDNEPQPDVIMMLPPHAGGRAIIDADGFITGPPALVCEIAYSSISIDLHAKKTAYRRNGVQEYLVWRTEDAVIDWFSLEAGDYAPIPPQADGTLCSKVFPGLCLQPSSLLAADLPGLFALMDNSTATPEHAEFVAKLSHPTPPPPKS